MKSFMIGHIIRRLQEAKRRDTLAYKLAVKAVPRPVRQRLFAHYFNKGINRGADVRTIFESIHDNNLWHSGESKSGFGSELDRTRSLRLLLEQWLSKHQGDIASLLDAPCGDFNWMKEVQFPKNVRYIGGDIVRSLTNDNNRAYGSEHRSFINLDIITDPIPHADAWLCRDVLFHFPFKEGRKVVEQFYGSQCKYFMSTTYSDSMNDRDIEFGWFRPINLSKAPYNLGEPVELWRDAPENEPNRYLGIWRHPRM